MFNCANNKRAIISTLSAVFSNPERNPSSPPFPPIPTRKSDYTLDPMDECVSVVDLIKPYRLPQSRSFEAWDWLVPKPVGLSLTSALEKGQDAIKHWVRTNPVRQWWFTHRDGRKCDLLSCMFFTDIISPNGVVGCLYGVSDNSAMIALKAMQMVALPLQ